jgi:hypothetical protein
MPIMNFTVQLGTALECARIIGSSVTEASKQGLQAYNWLIVEGVNDLAGDAGHSDWDCNNERRRGLRFFER